MKTLLRGQYYIPILFFFCFSSCFQDEPDRLFNEGVNVELSDWIMHESETRCVDFDDAGNAWIATQNQLVCYEPGGRQESWLTRSEILDIAVAPGGAVWMGTRDSGLVCFDGESMHYYTVENASFPRNLIAEVKAADDGTVWFTSCACRLGGLMRYDLSGFDLFTPENSILNQNIVANLCLDPYGNLYFSSAGTVGRSNVYRVSGDQWTNLGNEEGTFYWVSAMDVSYKGEIFLFEDYSLSSAMYENELYVYRDRRWQELETGFDMDFMMPVLADRRGYLWTVGYSGDSPILHVYDGREWHESEKGRLPECYIRSMEADPANSIWLCTTSGVLILEQ